MSRNTRLLNQPRIISARTLFGQKSPLITADLGTCIALCIGDWDGYDEAKRRSIIASLPPKHHVYERDEEGGLICPLKADFVLSDKHFKRAVARFQRDVADGYYEKSWQDKARKATADRVAGKFDEFLNGQADEKFPDSSGQDRELGEGTEDSDDDCIEPDSRNQNKKPKMEQIVENEVDGRTLSLGSIE